MSTPDKFENTSNQIEIEGLCKSYGDLTVLDRLSLEVRLGEVVSIIGPSGSGKSTLLRILMTLEKPDSGIVRINGESYFTEIANGSEIAATEAHIRKIRSRIGMVFQHFNLFPHMTALGNVMEAPVQVQGLSKAKAKELAKEYLALVGLEDKFDAYPAKLSGGQKQRVAIARALAMKPEIMLFDEITSALDPELVGGILDLLEKIAEKGDTTMLIVTHQMRFARESSNRILFFDHGHILEDGPPNEILSNPAHERTREFLQSIL